jgi:hypothetical protein
MLSRPHVPDAEVYYDARFRAPGMNSSRPTDQMPMERDTAPFGQSMARDEAFVRKHSGS